MLFNLSNRDKMVPKLAVTMNGVVTGRLISGVSVTLYLDCTNVHTPCYFLYLPCKL